jgi:hypothetical protein
MQQIFCDLLRERGGDSTIRFWMFILGDWGGSLVRAWRTEFHRESRAWLALGALAILPGAAFFTTVVLADILGIEAVASVQRAILGPPHTLRRTLADGVIVFSPLAASILSVLPWLKRGLLFDRSGRLALAGTRSGRLSLSVLTLAAGLGLIFLSYFLVENWPCLMGKAVAC